MEQKQNKPVSYTGWVIAIVVLFLIAAALAWLAFFGVPGDTAEPTPMQQGGEQAGEPSPTPTPEPTPTPSPTPYFHTPQAGDSASPAKFGFQHEIQVDGVQVERYQREELVSFGKGSEYNALEGVLTFRGNNYREGAAYGALSAPAKSLSVNWTVKTGSMQKGISSSGSGRWTGSGWVGQPLLVRWPQETKAVMNMYDWAKEKDGLVEVILATMDGNVYFVDLETGEKTRDKLKIGMPFKGAGSVDPRGYPILYLGSGEGYKDEEQDTRAMAYSLIDFTRLYEFGKREDEFSLRGWHAYDSAPLVDAKTDTLFYPGENGILYSVKLNTQFDQQAGTLALNPGPLVKYRYHAERTGDDAYWLGFESSAVGWGEYLYLADNAGLFQCINANTMETVWVQDTWDDTNGSPVLEEDLENHTAYLYVGTSLHWKKNSDNQGKAGFFKLDAVTGETVWTVEKDVMTVSGVSGGIQATAVLGRESISDLVIVPFARTPSRSKGELVAVNKDTGEIAWSFAMEAYAWSSPVAVYDESGRAYIIQCDTRSHVYLLDGATGALLDTLTIEDADYEFTNFEASPAVYGDILVIGARSEKIYGIQIH